MALLEVLYSSSEYLTASDGAGISPLSPATKKDVDTFDAIREAYGDDEGRLIWDLINDDPASCLTDPRPLVAKAAKKVLDRKTEKRTFLRPTPARLGDIYDSLGGRHWKTRTPGWDMSGDERGRPVEIWFGITTVTTALSVFNASGYGKTDPLIATVRLLNNNLKGDVNHLLKPLGELQVATNSLGLFSIHLAVARGCGGWSPPLGAALEISGGVSCLVVCSAGLTPLCVPACVSATTRLCFRPRGKRHSWR